MPTFMQLPPLWITALWTLLLSYGVRRMVAKHNPVSPALKQIDTAITIFAILAGLSILMKLLGLDPR